FGLYSIRHPKEQRLPNPDLTDSRPYVFGKINSLIIARANYGGKRMLANRLLPNAIRVDLNYSIGGMMGFLKPHYYQVRVPNPDGGDPSLVDERFDPDNETQQENIVGNSSFFKGIKETTFMPGGDARMSLNFEWGTGDYKYWSLETGIMADVFPQEVP